MSTPDYRLTAFAYRRQRLDGSAPDAFTAVEAAIAVYAANPRGPLSILARAPTATAADVLALERDGRVVRGRAKRASAFVVPAGPASLVAAPTAQPLAGPPGCSPAPGSRPPGSRRPGRQWWGRRPAGRGRRGSCVRRWGSTGWMSAASCRTSRCEATSRCWRGVSGRMEADLDLFERPAPRLRDAIEERLRSIAAFLGYRELRVRDVPTVLPNRRRVRRPLE